MNDDGLFWWVLGIIVVLLIVGGFFWQLGEGAERTDAMARRILREDGIEVTSFRNTNTWSCGEGDFFAYSFKGEKSNGSHVQGTVCCGLTKDCTVRRR